jgi:hypothetical protein
VGTERLRTRTTDVWLDGEVLRGREDPGTETVIGDAIALVDAIRKLGGGVRLPVVMEISESKSVTREARAYLASDAVAEVVTMIGLVVGSSLSRALGSFWLTFNRPKFTVKLFTSVDEALAWVRAPR